jgi:septal ring factor EnvC (AmiA/AmiB activator)
MAEIEGKNSLKVDKDQARATNRILVIIIILLSIVLGVTLWQYFELRKTVDQKGTEIELLDDERNEIENELENMLNEFDSLETDNDSMKVELSQRRQEVEELLDKVKDKDFAIYKLRKETKTLRGIMQGYVVTIDSLNTMNIGLRKENETVRQTLSAERSRTQKLKKSNENLTSKVALASRLDVNNVRIFGVKVKRDMTGKEVDRARRADKLRACFVIDENKVAKAEKKNIYLRIIAPDGTILTPGEGDDYKFEFNGVKGYYSDNLKIDYDNTAKEYCLDWAKPNDDYEMQEGIYNIFLYAEDYEMASTTYELR